MPKKGNQNVIGEGFDDNEEELKEEKKDNNLLINEPADIDIKKKKEENPLIIDSVPNNNVINPVKKEENAIQKSNVHQQLEEVSKSSGLKMKAYFVEENKNEIDELNNGSKNVTHFNFNGNMKDFYSKVYRHVVESNLIARQLTDGQKREALPSLNELSKQFEDFMKATGEELVKRGHLDKYVPYGGLSAKELRDIENSCLLNRPRNEKEALERNASKLSGKNYDEIIENGYKNAEDKIKNFFDPTYKKGDNPELDRKFLRESSDLIKGMKIIRDKEKVWETYLPDVSAPKWNRPIYKHPISNAFKAIGKGIKIVLDATIKTPIVNVWRGIKYPFAKAAQAISTAYNQRNLENLVTAKGFSKEELNDYLNDFEKSALDVEKDSKELDINLKERQNAIEQFNKKPEEKDVVKDNNEVKVENKEQVIENKDRVPIFVNEALDNYYNQEIVPEINDNLNLNKEKQLNNGK